MEKMKTEYLDGSTILSYALGEDEELDSLSLEMLKNKELKEFLYVSYTQMDTNRYLNYDITGLTSIHEIFQAGGTFRKLYNVFTGIIDALNMVDEYMLVKESVLLDDNYIFADGDYKTKMVCLPIKNIRNSNPDIRRFFKNILIDYPFDESDEHPYIRKVAAYLNSEDFNLDGMKKLLKLIQTDNMGKVSKKPTVINTQPVSEPVTEPVKEPKEPVVKPSDNKRQENAPVTFIYDPEDDNYGDDVVPASDPKEKGEEKMSLMYLLHNFSGENLKKYKEGRKKEEAAPKKEKPEKKADKKKEKAAKKPKANLDLNFAKPGKEEHIEFNYAIPGREEKKSEADVMPVVDEAEKNAEELINNAVKDYDQKKQNNVVQKENLYDESYNSDYEMTIALDDGFDEEATVALVEDIGAKKRPSAYLIRKKTGEKIYITSDSFSLGKQSSEVDYCISNNVTISRCHCYIKFEDGLFYLQDNNAKNFTYINGEKLQSRGKSVIKTGDIIKLSNENFEFVID